jgi:hypothetical protein
MLAFHSTLENFFQRNFHEEITRLALEATSTTARRSMRSTSAREVPTTAGSGSTSSITGAGDKRASRAMTLGRGGPSLYANAHLSQLYGAGSNSPHGLHFDVNGGIVPNGAGVNSASARGDLDSQPTPLQRNLAQLTRSGIPGMSSALISGALANSPIAVNGAATVDSLNMSRGQSKSPLGAEHPSLAGKPSIASFATASPKGGKQYQQSTISRNASLTNTISGRLSRFGSILRKGDR